MASFILGTLALAMAACNGGSESKSEPATTSDAATGSAFKVALVTPGKVSDAGWNAMAYSGLMEIEKELGATVNTQEARGTQIKDALRTYAQQGYNMVIGHGYEYNAPAFEVAQDFPEVVFVTSSGDKTAKNLGAFRFYLEQAFYLAGYTAGLMSKSGTVAMIGGDDVPSIRSTFKAFRAGAEAAKPGIRVIEVFTGDGQDVAKAQQAALQAIDQGADFLIHQANNAAQGVFNAAKERGVYAFGANMNQNANESGVVLASAVIDPGPAFLNLAKQVRDKSFEGSIVLMGMQDGAINYVWNPAMEDKVPSDVREKVTALASQILANELVVPKDEF